MYPLPDNFRTPRVFSIPVHGGQRREINPSSTWIWSRDRSRIYFVRDTAAGAEVWTARADGSGMPRRLALLAGSGRGTFLDWSPDFSKLAVVAGAVWVVGGDGSEPRVVFTPMDRPVSSFSWSRDGSRLTLLADDLWSVLADGSGATRLFAVGGGRSIDSYSASPDGSRTVVTSHGDMTLVSSEGAAPVSLGTDAVEGIEWTRDGQAFAVENVSFANCGPSSTKCAGWYLSVFDRSGIAIARIGQARSADWSPDGKRLVFESGLFALEPERGTIDVANRDGSGLTTVSSRLTKGGDSCWRYPFWQGKSRVTFDESGCDPDYYETGTRNVVVEVASGRLIRSIAGTDLSASPDRTRVVYLRARGDDVVLYGATAGGRKARRLSRAHGVVDEAAWSPDGRFIAFTYAGDDVRNNQQIYVVAWRGGRARQVTRETSRSWIWGLVWSADGRRLSYSSTLDTLAYPSLWTMASDGSDLRRLTHGGASEDTPAWSPDGRRVAFTRYLQNRSEIHVVNANGRGEHRLVGKAQERNTRPEWSPDGRRIAFVREVKGSLYLSIANADGTDAHVLRDAGSPYGQPSWSPDGRWIVYSDSGATITAVSPDGKQKRALLRVDCTAGCPYYGDTAFSADGRQIAFTCSGCDATGGSALWVMDADGGNVHRITASPAGHPSWSGDGRSIVFSGTACSSRPAPDEDIPSQLCVVDADGGNLRALTAWPFDSYGPSWSKR